jgi:hypothetical protein
VGESGNDQAYRIGRDVDDASPAALAHETDKRLGHQEHRIEIDREDAPPVVERDLIEALHRIDAGIVDEDVAAAGALLDLPLQAGDALRIADVAADGLRFAAGALDQLQGLSGILAVGDDDPGALLRQPHGRGLTDAGRRTRITATLPSSLFAIGRPPCPARRLPLALRYAIAKSCSRVRYLARHPDHPSWAAARRAQQTQALDLPAQRFLITCQRPRRVARCRGSRIQQILCGNSGGKNGRSDRNDARGEPAAHGEAARIQSTAFARREV